jgi:hypothetical protein
MIGDVVQIPAERIPPVATEASSNSKVIAGLLLSLFVIALIACIGVLGENKHKEEFRDSAEAAGHAIGTVIGVFIMVGLPALFGFKAARNASRATRAAAATANRNLSWRLSGKFIIAADSAGVPQPDVSFKISNKLRTMLLALPRADLITR